jgi:hypothetical protein
LPSDTARAPDLMSERAVESVVTAVRVHAETLSRGALLSIDETGTRARILPLRGRRATVRPAPVALPGWTVRLLVPSHLTESTNRTSNCRATSSPVRSVCRLPMNCAGTSRSDVGCRPGIQTETDTTRRGARGARDAFGAPAVHGALSLVAAQQRCRHEGRRLARARGCHCAANGPARDARVVSSLSASRPPGYHGMSEMEGAEGGADGGKVYRPLLLRDHEPSDSAVGWRKESRDVARGKAASACDAGGCGAGWPVTAVESRRRFVPPASVTDSRSAE